MMNKTEWQRVSAMLCTENSFSHGIVLYYNYCKKKNSSYDKLHCLDLESKEKQVTKEKPEALLFCQGIV